MNSLCNTTGPLLPRHHWFSSLSWHMPRPSTSRSLYSCFPSARPHSSPGKLCSFSLPSPATALLRPVSALTSCAWFPHSHSLIQQKPLMLSLPGNELVYLLRFRCLCCISGCSGQLSTPIWILTHSLRISWCPQTCALGYSTLEESIDDKDPPEAEHGKRHLEKNLHLSPYVISKYLQHQVSQ